MSRCCTPPATYARPAAWTGCSTSKMVPSRTVCRGTQQIAQAAAAQLGARVLLNAAVRRIDRHGAGVTVTSDQGQAEAGFVIVAIPPAHRVAIEFDPRCRRNISSSPTIGRRAG